MNQRRPFRVRLAMRMALLGVGTLTLTLAVVYGIARAEAARNLDDTLGTLARTEVVSSADRVGGGVHVHDSPGLEAGLASAGGVEKYTLVLDGSGRVVARTQNLEPPQLPALISVASAEPAERPRYVSLRIGRGDYRALVYEFQERPGSTFTGVVAVSEQPWRAMVARQLKAMAIVLGVGTLLVIAGSYFLAGRATRPLERLAAEVQEVTDATTGHRWSTSSLDQELVELVAGLNRMMTRLEAGGRSREAALAAQRRFVADASHELRNPLNNLRGGAEVALRRERPPEEYREVLKEMHTEAVRLGRVVDRLLILARADSGRLPLETAEVDLRQLASDAVAGSRRQAEQAGVAVVCEGSEVRIQGDPGLLRQVLDNLLDNAIRHAPTGSSVTVRVWEGDAVNLEVVDRGAGVPESQRPHIFDRFFRADPGSSPRGGSGLGLAISRAIAEAHGGTLALVDGDGPGATFRLTLPRVVSG